MPTVSHRTDLCQGPLHRAGSGLLALPIRIARRIARWVEHRRQMRQLLELDEHLLRDIGLSNADQWRVAARGRTPSQKP